MASLNYKPLRNVVACGRGFEQITCGVTTCLPRVALSAAAGCCLFTVLIASIVH